MEPALVTSLVVGALTFFVARLWFDVRDLRRRIDDLSR